MDFWVTNFSNMNVSLADLNLTIKAYSSVNLLDKKHYYYTLEQLQESAKTGSIAKKSSKLFVRQVAPEKFDSKIHINTNSVIPNRGRSIISNTEEKYDELNVSDEQFAEENAEIAELDRQPIIQGK